MYHKLSRPIFRATGAMRAAGVNAGEGGASFVQQMTHTDPRADHKRLVKEARKDPELHVLYIITAATLALSGWHLARFWSAGSDETETSRIPDTEPWKDGAQGSTGRYKYYPRGDTSEKPKDAPSALNSVIVPNVNLPRELHEKYNKWGKEEYNDY